MKFTAQGSIHLEADWQAGDAENGQVIIQVSDTGMGIDADSIERIFEPFTQASPNASRQNGAGLGLTISRQIAALMGGTLDAFSGTGQGSTFRLTLPVQRAPAAADAPPSDAPLAGLRILLLAAQPPRESALRKTLLAWKTQVVICPDAAQILPMLREASALNAPFHIALLDDAAPGLEALAPIRALAADPALRETQAALLIAPRRLRDTRALREAGVAAWLRKPVRQSHLRRYAPQSAGTPRRAAGGERGRGTGNREQGRDRREERRGE